MSNAIVPPILQYTNTDGSPLEMGSIYLGVSGQFAEVAPIVCYWDRALTQPAAQPLLTINGYIARSGTPANVFIAEDDYSISIRNKKTELVYSVLSAEAAGFVTSDGGGMVVTASAVINLVQNSNFVRNTRGVSGTIVLPPGSFGHDFWYAGSTGCTYTFATVDNVTTISIAAGTLVQNIDGTRTFDSQYTLSWVGTAQARISTGGYSTSPLVSSITGGVDLTIEIGVGSLSTIQFEKGVTANSYTDGIYQPTTFNFNNIYDLRAAYVTIDPGKAAYAQTTGYLNPGDGGEAHYWYDASDTSSADNAGSILVGTSGRRWKLLNTVWEARQWGAQAGGGYDNAATFQAMCNAAPVSAKFTIADGIYLINSAVTAVGKNIMWETHNVVLTGPGSLPGTYFQVGNPAPAQTYLGQAFIDTTNQAYPLHWEQHLPNTVDLVPGVRGLGVWFSGDCSAKTPGSGDCENNMIRMSYDYNSDAGPWARIHMINGTYTMAQDEAGTGNENAVYLGTGRCTGPTSGTKAVGIWCSDFHVEKSSGVIDGKMICCEIGVHKVPALGVAECIGADIWSGDRDIASGTTRAGKAINIHGEAGWTYMLQAQGSVGQGVVWRVDQNGDTLHQNFVGNAVHTVISMPNSSATTVNIQAHDSGGSTIGLILQMASGGATIGTSTNQPVILKANNNECFRLIDGFTLGTTAGNESTGAGSAALGANCPAATPTAPWRWIKIHTSDGGTAYIPAWK